MRRRSIFSITVLSIITCGIYYPTTWVQVLGDINYSAKENDAIIIDLLPSFVTYGIWGTFRFRKYSKKLYMIGAGGNNLINVLFVVFDLPIISLCIMQNSINDLIDCTY